MKAAGMLNTNLFRAARSATIRPAHWLGMVAVGLTLSCTDTTGVHRPVVGAGGRAPQLVRWNTGPSPLSLVAQGDLAVPADGKGGVTVGPDGEVFGAAQLIALDRYVATFWAVRGQARQVEIGYQSQVGQTAPFLRFEVRDAVRRPDGSLIAEGDSVLITITVDTVNLGVHFAPTGLEFAPERPARLSLWYGGAGGDLNGDGVVDGQDAEIEVQLLGMSYRRLPTDPWEPFTAHKDVAQKRLDALLEHFSGYAVSW